MFSQLYDIERQCSRIPGALAQIVLIDPADLLSEPVWYELPNIDALDFKPGKDVYRFDCDHFTSRLTDRHNAGSQVGDFFEYTLTATVRGIRLDVDLLRKRLMNRRIHVVATYADGYQRFLPNIRLTGDSDSSNRRLGRNEYTFTGTTRLTGPAPGLDATLTPPSGGESGGGGGTSEMFTINTTSSSTSYSLTAGTLLDNVIIVSDASCTVNIGTTPGGTDITSGIEVTAGEASLLGAALFYAVANTTIYISGLSGTVQIKLDLVS